jgi:hypothetical protein
MDFRFDFERGYVPLARVFGITRGSCRVRVTSEEFIADFGP